MKITVDQLCDGIVRIGVNITPSEQRVGLRHNLEEIFDCAPEALKAAGYSKSDKKRLEVSVFCEVRDKFFREVRKLFLEDSYIVNCLQEAMCNICDESKTLAKVRSEISRAYERLYEARELDRVEAEAKQILESLGYKVTKNDHIKNTRTSNRSRSL